MRLGTIGLAEEHVWRPAAFVGDDHYVDLRALPSGDAFSALLHAASHSPAWLDSIHRSEIAALVADAPTCSLVGVRIGPPVPYPGKIIACGRNYMDHFREGQKIWAARGKAVEKPQIPVAFIKLASAITHHGATIDIPADITDVDYEVELAVVIGTAAHRVSVGQALDYVAGYTICNDVASRPIQFAEMEQQIGIVMGKNLPTFAPIGPYIVTADEIPDPHALEIGLRVNGGVRQAAHTSDMIFSVAELVSYWSRLGLQVGDILLSGTPAGVAVGRPAGERERYFLKDGDHVDAWVEDVGTLSNAVRSLA